MFISSAAATFDVNYLTAISLSVFPNLTSVVFIASAIFISSSESLPMEPRGDPAESSLSSFSLLSDTLAGPVF